MPKKPTFKEAYHTLQKNAEQLEKTDDLDIDNLVSTVEESIKAYKICQERILAVEKALAKAFDDDLSKEK